MELSTIADWLQIATLISFFFIASQGAFYNLAFGKALRQIPPDHFIALRRTVDPAIRIPLKVLYLGTLPIFIIWVIIIINLYGIENVLPCVAALIVYIIDIVLVVKLSEPLNKLINSSVEIKADVAGQLQQKWINAITVRGYLSVTGFIIMLVYTVYK